MEAGWRKLDCNNVLLGQLGLNNFFELPQLKYTRWLQWAVVNKPRYPLQRSQFGGCLGWFYRGRAGESLWPCANHLRSLPARYRKCSLDCLVRLSIRFDGRRVRVMVRLPDAGGHSQ